MKWDNFIIPAISACIALGVSAATLQAVASDTVTMADRLRGVELKQAEDETTKVMVSQNTERLERLEAVVMENARQLTELREDMAAVCQATGARCK